MMVGEVFEFFGFIMLDGVFYVCEVKEYFGMIDLLVLIDLLYCGIVEVGGEIEYQSEVFVFLCLDGGYEMLVNNGLLVRMV